MNRAAAAAIERAKSSIRSWRLSCAGFDSREHSPRQKTFDQAIQFRDKEQQFAALSKEYREKLEQIKFERERIALKEEQFCRQF